MGTTSLVQPLIGCLGYPVAGNATQFVMERAFQSLGLDWRAFTAEVSPEELLDAVRGARAMHFAGLALFQPHQHSLLTWCDSLTIAASISQRISVLKNLQGEWIGHDTRGEAILGLLGAHEIPSEGAVGVLDSTIAELVRLADHGKKYRVLTADQSAVAGNENGPSEETTNPPAEEAKEIAAWILGGSPSPERLERIHAQAKEPGCVYLVMDSERAWIGQLRAAAKVLSPMDYLTQKSVEAFRFWTGLTVPWQVVREALDEYHEW
jgi:shikimate dehydrogenase